MTSILVPVHSVPGCNFRANLVILAQICDKLSSGQAKFPRILSQNGQNDLEGQGQWLPFSIPAESITGCMFGTNLVVLAQVCDELLCRQAKKKIQNSKSKWPKLPWRSRSMASIFSTNCEYPMMHFWCKFGDSSSNLWWVIIRTRLSLRTDERMDGRTSFSMNKPTTWCKSGRVSLVACTKPSSRGRLHKYVILGRQTDTGNDNTPSAWKAKGWKWSEKHNIAYGEEFLVSSCNQKSHHILYYIYW